MKKLTYLLAAAAVFTACNSGNNGYTVTGTIEGATDGDTVYLQTVEGRQLVKLDSAIIANGTFTFKGTQDTAANRYITYNPAGTEGMIMDFFLENGKINIKLNEKQRESKSKEMDALQDKMMEVAKAGISQNITNAVGVHLLKSNYYYLDVKELDPLVSQIPATYSNDATVIRIKENVEKMKATAVGKKFTDFEMQTPEGKTVKLSDYVGKGKTVLVDFWASWCGPCRREMPNLVEAYAKYKNKNFEIVGVSLDQSADSWKEAIKKLNITWPQMSDLKYWNCEGAKLYAVSSIPHTVLIDGDGIILARGLHGEELQEKLAEVLK